MWWFFIRLGDFLVSVIYSSNFFPGNGSIVRYRRDDHAICGHFLFGWLLWGIGWPIILVKTFRRDTAYWAGGFNDCQSGPCDDLLADLRWLLSLLTCGRVASFPDYTSSKRTFSQLPQNDVRRPLFQLGVSPNEISTVRRGLDVVPSDILIKYCELSLDASIVLGTGGTARVFVGKYENRKVAIKMITCFELTPKIVYSFFDEALLLYKCAEHPNILDMYGICVAPPTLCLVLELAKGGDLTTDLKEYAEYRRRDLAHVASLEALCHARGELLKFLNDAIQCAKPVAYLHSKSPPLLHRDIKSMNYLVTIEEVGEASSTKMCYKCPFVDTVGANLSAEESVKAYLQNKTRYAGKMKPKTQHSEVTKRAISFSAPRANATVKRTYRSNSMGQPFSKFNIQSKRARVADFAPPYQSTLNFKNKLVRNRRIKLADLGLSGENKYTNFESGSSEYSLLWAAPEVLIGEPNTIKSDVYSLTIVLWEILNPGLQPYYDVEDLSHISDQIICGLRPPLEPANASKPVENKAEYDAALVHSQLSSLFNRGWHADPNERPTAIEFVDCLENIKGML
eukprot:g1937.t1